MHASITFTFADKVSRDRSPCDLQLQRCRPAAPGHVTRPSCMVRWGDRRAMQSAWAPNKSFTVTDGGEHIRVMHVHFPKRERSRHLCAASGMGRFDPAHSFRVPVAVGVNPIRDRYTINGGAARWRSNHRPAPIGKVLDQIRPSEHCSRRQG
jgi:hypothetical protein